MAEEKAKDTMKWTFGGMMTYFTDPVGNALSVPVASSLIGFSSDLKKAYDAGTPEQQSILAVNAIRKNITILKDLDNWMKF